MTTNGNIYRNFLKYFAKKHLGFAENLSSLCENAERSLRKTDIFTYYF